MTGIRSRKLYHREDAQSVGHYAVERDVPVSREPSGVICPYCRGPMQRLVVPRPFTIGRIVQAPVLDHGAERMVSTQTVPPEYRVLRCTGCKETFVAPPEEGTWRPS